MMDTQYINNLLSKNINSETKILIAVSGGVDSMSVFYLVYLFFIKNNFDTKHIYVGHYNHKFRQESDIEQQKLAKHFANQNINWITYNYQYDKFDEKSLRQARRSFLGEIINQNQINIVITGHNLDDQIETTIMNQSRGASLKGIMNMQPYQSATIYQSNYLYHDYFTGILRPLLKTSKSNIYKYANNLCIQYFEDKTNQDPNISVRNFLRNQIHNLTHIGPKIFENFVIENDIFMIKLLGIYSQDINNIYITKQKCHTRYVDIDNFWLIKNDSIRSSNQIVYVLDQFGLANNITVEYINDLWKFVLYNQSGYKQLSKNFRLYICHSHIYIIRYSDGNKLIQKNDFEIYHDNMILKFPEYKLRLTKDNDRFHNKSINEYLSNRKIPVFLRKYIVLIVDNYNKIIDIIV